MANIPPKSFFKLSTEEQEAEAVRRMNICYQAYEDWKKLAQAARKGHIHEPQEIDRPDLALLKD